MPRGRTRKGSTTTKEKKVGKVTKTVKQKDKDLKYEDHTIDLPEDFEGPTAQVGINLNRTINLFDYNSLKIGVSISFPTKPTETEAMKTLKTIKSMAEDYLCEEVDNIERLLNEVS